MKRIRLDTAFKRGREQKPLIVFIHGLGMDLHMWAHPEKARMLAGNLPLSCILSQKPGERSLGVGDRRPRVSYRRMTSGVQPRELKTLFHDLGEKGYPVITWSQTRPVGPIREAVEELKELIARVRDWTRRGIILIGHSRGGLIARKYLETDDRDILALVTIGTPHKGSSLAKLEGYIFPLAQFLSPLFSSLRHRGVMKKTLKRVSDLLESGAARELLPGSDFYASLKDRPAGDIFMMSVGGTNPSLFSLYRWKIEIRDDGEGRQWLLVPERIISVPYVFEKIIPQSLYPDELRHGCGDGLVSAESSRLDRGYRHYDFHLNHVELLFDHDVRELISGQIESIS